ncbi:MAG: transposase [Arsenophonus sp. NEOnobi-MAG3]
MAWLNLISRFAIGDGFLGFWNVMAKIFQDTKHQRCLVHQNNNVLALLFKGMELKIKDKCCLLSRGCTFN